LDFPACRTLLFCRRCPATDGSSDTVPESRNRRFAPGVLHNGIYFSKLRNKMQLSPFPAGFMAVCGCNSVV
ncbi:hypothetical protein, partial [Alistipes putredinis]|uniref:hypothetical protein n=1 Tax=Alistipes putredinis TaxID=28117 RepID=UPI003AF02318